jgi:hypothetical protein
MSRRFLVALVLFALAGTAVAQQTSSSASPAIQPNLKSTHVIQVAVAVAVAVVEQIRRLLRRPHHRLPRFP